MRRSHAMLIWVLAGLVAGLAIWVHVARDAAAPVVAAMTATPCAGATPMSGGSYVYRAGVPIILAGTGNSTTTLTVRNAPNGYLAAEVTYGGNDRFGATMTAPDGTRENVFAAIHPDGESTIVRAQQPGQYVLTVEASGPWAVVIS